jgi:predicted MFS family arabinose efflux permease
MAELSHTLMPSAPRHRPGVPVRTIIIGLTAFLTLVDLFATQAILPSLTRAYGVTPAAMGVAVNASTLGMAIASLAVAMFGRRIDRRWGILISMAALSIPTALLATAPDLTIFTILRIAQGLCMATAFTLMLAHLGEQCSAAEAHGAFAAYITGNVASNFVGRLLSAAVADHFGLASNFYLFALLNLAGAVLVYVSINSPRLMAETPTHSPAAVSWTVHLRDPALCAAFGTGFCILFAFIGTFTYVNFVLVRKPLSLGMMQVGFVYAVFAPSILTTLLAGHAAARIGTRNAIWVSLALAGGGLPLLLVPKLLAVLAGMVLVAIGTFAAQAVATGFVGQAVRTNRGAASGLYLASYFFGGLAGSAVLGQIFDRAGWAACVVGIGLALAAAAGLATLLRTRLG